MKKLLPTLLLTLLIPFKPAVGQTFSQKEAVALAERFIAENGYTKAQPKDNLDFESIERTDNRAEMLRRRHNTLEPRAIGAKSGRRGSKLGWSVAFAYASPEPSARESCRVVTMDSGGENVRVEHVDGIRKYFVGFN